MVLIVRDFRDIKGNQPYVECHNDIARLGIKNGFVYQDVDVSGGAKSASIMTGGYYNKEKLPESLSTSDETELAKHGLFSRKRGEANMTNSYNKIS